jgi:hypothetical protein
MMRYMLSILGWSLAALFVTVAPVHAQPPGPYCPGDGDEIVVMAAVDGWCDFMFTPDGNHVHCKWAGFDPMIDFGSETRCRRVHPDGSLVSPEPTPPADAGPLPTNELNNPGG